MTTVSSRAGRRAFAAAVILAVLGSLLSVVPAADAAPPEVALVTASSVGTPDDQLIAGVLTAAGYTVTILDDDSVNASSADGIDVVVITSSASALKVGSTFRSVVVPVVNYEFLLSDDLGLTLNGSSRRGEQGTFRAVDVVDSGHVIVGGLFSGSTDVFRRFSKVSWGVPSGDADVVATQLNDSGRAVLFTYESGDVLADGSVAAGRRAGVFLAAASDGLLNATGEQLLVNTIAWAASSGNQPPTASGSLDQTSGTAPLTVNVDGTASADSDGIVAAYFWNFGDGATATTAIASNAYTNPGSYPVSLMVTDNKGATDTTVIGTVQVAGEPGDSGPATFTTISVATGELPTPPAGSTTDQTSLATADFDGDGDEDLVIAGRDGNNSVQWYRRSAAGLWDLYIIESDIVDVEAGGTVGDVDADGDIDLILAGDRDSNEIWWWENPGSGYDPATDWTRHTILSTGPVKHHDVRFGDVDHDGQPELVYWTQGLPSNRVDDLFVAEVPANPKAVGDWSTTRIYDAPIASEGIELADVDLDGNTDLIAGGRLFTYNTGAGTYASSALTSVAFGRYVVGQVIDGGRPEIVVSSGDEIGPLDLLSWNGTGWTTTSLLDGSSGVSSPWNRGHSVDLGDVNGDGSLDIYSAEMYLVGSADSAKTSARAVIWYGDGQGGFETDVLTVGSDNHESQLADVDGDGDIDVVSKPFNLAIPSLEIHLNQRSGPSTSSLTSWSKHIIDTKPARAMFIFNADIDGDGDDDLVTGGWWYENPGTITGDWNRRTIGGLLEDALVVSDLDGDGNLDIFGARGPAGTSPRPRQFAWAKGDGTGNFTVHSNIESGQSSFIQGAEVVQFSQGGQTEIWLSWNDRSNLLQKIVIPANPTVTQWTLQTGSAVSQGEEIEFADIDGDSDLDVIEGHIWLENLGDDISFADHELHTPTSCCFPGVVDTMPLPDRVVVGDINEDGRLDVVVSHEYDPAQRVVWYEQPIGDPTGEWTEHEIGRATYAIHSLDVLDMDDDGDLDVVAGEHIQAPDPIETGQVLVFENNGAGQSWSTRLVDDTDAHHDGTQLADLDGDGDLDIFSIGWEHNRVLIYENTFGGGGGPDTNPPALTGISVSATETRAEVTWSTNEPATSAVYYGLSTDYTDSVAMTAQRRTHAIGLTGLVCGTTYHYEASSSDAATNVGRSGDLAFATPPCGSDVLALLPLDDGGGTNAADQSPNGNDGTLINGASFDSSSGDGSASSVRFDGVNDAISLGNLDVQGDQISLAAWFNGDSFPGNSSDPRLISKATGLQAADHLFMLSTIEVADNLRLRGRVRINGSTTTLIASSGAISTGGWQHGAMTYDGATLRLYLDGVEVGSTPLSGVVDTDPSVAVFVGGQPTGAGSRPFDGRIDDVRILQRVLDTAEISAIANP